MKKKLLFCCFVMITLVVFDCGKKDDDSCVSPQVFELLPNNNPANGPVMVQGSGFNANSEVRFGNVKATIEEFSDSFITTKVPNGLLSLVELSVSNGGGNCLDFQNFEVTNAFPSNLPTSPPSIIIPAGGFSFPIQVSSNEQMYMKNAFDESHTLRFGFFRPVVDFNQGDERYTNGTHPISGSQDLTKNFVELFINRSSSNLPNEHLIGGYFTMELEVNGELVLNNFLIAFSQITGRQYVFYQDL